MSELSQPKKPRVVSEEDTLAEGHAPAASPGGGKAETAKADGTAKKSSSKNPVVKAKPTLDLDKTDPDHGLVAAEAVKAADAAKTKAESSASPPPAEIIDEATVPAGPVATPTTSGVEKTVPDLAVLGIVAESAPEEKTADASAAMLAEKKATKPASDGPIVVRVFGRTDVGQVREHNEDNFVVADLTKASRGLMEHDRVQTVGERGTVLGVCDGMGGAAAGEVASQLAVDIVYQRMLAGDPPATRDDLASRLVASIENAGMRIFSEAKADRSRRGMGTTSTVAALVDNHLFFGQVGDSRAYLLRGDKLVQVTRDQSLVNQLIEAGQLTEEEAETFEHNNIILQALGTAETVQVDLTYVELRRGDTLLLCSDGLSGMVRNDEIREVLRSFDEPLEACRELTDRANLAGGHDNVTVVVAKFEGEGLKVPTPEDIADLKYRKYELPELVARGSGEPSGQHHRTSLRPKPSNSPDIEVGYDEYDSEYGDENYRGDDPVELPREQAPSWIVTMMIVSAVTCVVVAGYYLLVR